MSIAGFSFRVGCSNNDFPEITNKYYLCPILITNNFRGVGYLAEIHFS